MNPAQFNPTVNQNPRDYQPNRAQENLAEEIVLHSHVGAKILGKPTRGTGQDRSSRGIVSTGGGRPHPELWGPDESAQP